MAVKVYDRNLGDLIYGLEVDLLERQAGKEVMAQVNKHEAIKEVNQKSEQLIVEA